MKLRSGRVLDAYIVGLTLKGPDGGENHMMDDALKVFDGYDSVLAEPPCDWMEPSEWRPPFTDDEKRELAEHMIRRWKQWGGL